MDHHSNATYLSLLQLNFLITENRPREIVDPLCEGVQMESLDALLSVAIQCVSSSPEDRPTMHRVVQLLESEVVTPCPSDFYDSNSDQKACKGKLKVCCCVCTHVTANSLQVRSDYRGSESAVLIFISVAFILNWNYNERGPSLHHYMIEVVVVLSHMSSLDMFIHFRLCEWSCMCYSIGGLPRVYFSSIFFLSLFLFASIVIFVTFVHSNLSVYECVQVQVTHSCK